MTRARRPAAPGASLTALNGLCLCLVLCAAGLVVSGAAGPAHAAVLVAAAAWQRWRWGGGGGAPDARRWWWEAASLLALLFFIADLFLITRNLVGAALRLLVFIVAYHADNPQSARRARQTLGLTLIQMIAASASTTEVTFSVLMGAYLVAALWCLAAIGAAETEPGRTRLGSASPAPALRAPLGRLTLAASPVVVAAGLGIFFLLPHYGTGYFREGGKSLRRDLTGFSGRIELGSIGRIKKSHATVMRITRKGGGGIPPLPLRLRGVALDSFNGRAWEMSDQDHRILHRGPAGAYVLDGAGLDALSGDPPGPGRTLGVLEARRDVLSLDILIEPIASQVLFTPPDPLMVATTRFHSVLMDRGGDLYAAGPRMRRFPYRIVSRLDPPPPRPGEIVPLSDADRKRYLQLPTVDPRVAAIGRRITAGIRGDRARARALEAYLKSHYAYSLDVNDAAVRDPLVHLLVERAPGHCEYFSTALAVLLRLQEIPSRVITGFNGGEYSELTGQTIIRQSDAHSWVEAWLPDEGWTVLDATPPESDFGDLGMLARMRSFFDEVEIAWDTYIVGLDLQDQGNAYEEVRDWFDLTAAGTFIRLREAAARIREMIGFAGVAFPASDALLGLIVFLAAAAIAVAGSALLLRRLFGKDRALHPATILFGRFERAAARQGGPRDPSVSPAAFARGLRAGDVADAYEAARYGPPPEQRAALDRLRRLVTARRAG